MIQTLKRIKAESLPVYNQRDFRATTGYAAKLFPNTKIKGNIVISLMQLYDHITLYICL